MAMKDELGKIPRPGQLYPSYGWFGVSLFIDGARVERFARTALRRGQHPRIAELRFRAEPTLHGVYTGKTTHLEVFGIPQVFLAFVDSLSEVG